MQAHHERRRLFWGGITGGSFVAVTQLATRDVIQTPHLTALICFAIVLPFAAVFTMSSDEFPIKDLPKNRRRVFQEIAAVIGMLFWIGVAALFFAFRPVLALIFVVSAAVAMIANNYVVKFLREARSKNSTKHSDASSG
jgi:hypothetical protein